MKKFELTNETKTICGKTLFRIKALISFGNVSAGDLGGFIEKEENLSHSGRAWVYGDAKVYGDAEVYGNARVYGNAWVYGNAQVYDNACVYGNAWVYDNAKVCGDAMICSDTDYMSIKGLGSKYRSTTIFRTKGKNIAVRCGCFYGTLTEFVDRVKEAHGNSKYAKEYLALVDLVKIHFESEE